jgi:hypothetical protein
MKLRIVDDQACPKCGAYWGHPKKALDWPNRIKVDDDWRCYNPKCDVAFYQDGQILEMELSPEDHKAMCEKVKNDLAGRTIKVIEYDDEGNKIESSFTMPS